MTRSVGREWTDEEFEKRKQFLIDTLNNFSTEHQEEILKDEKTRDIWIRLIMSGMYGIQYERKFSEFEEKWLEMKKLYIDMIELMLKEGNLTKGHEFEDAKYRIKEDCNLHKLRMTDNLSDHIYRYFMTQDDREYLEQFVDYPEQTTKSNQ